MLRIVSIAAVADIQYADADPRGGREPRECVDRLQNAILHRNNRDLDWGVVLGDIIDWDDIDHTPSKPRPPPPRPIGIRHSSAGRRIFSTRSTSCSRSRTESHKRSDSGQTFSDSSA